MVAVSRSETGAFPRPKSAAERRRMLELIAIFFTTVLLIGLSRLETRLFELSETLAKSQDFFTTVVFFGLINLNVILILLLSFLLFRQVAKLVVERRRGVFGSNLRAKLVATLVFFALAPTILLFYVSSRFIVTSFDEWFSEKVRLTMHQTREAGARVYKQDQRRLESLARIALQRIHIDTGIEGLLLDGQLILPGQLEGFDAQYGLDGVEVLDRHGLLLWASTAREDHGIPALDPFITESLQRFSTEPGLMSLSTVAGEEQRDVVKGAAPIFEPNTRELLGIVVTETRFETQILRSIETIQQSFANLRPSAQLIKLSYLILLLVMTLLIMFSAVWLGFYVARGIIGPIQSLADGTREVALGNYDVSLSPRTDDETGQLVRSFNLMTKDLQKHRYQADEARRALLRSNEELEARRRYMEVVLQSISAGVMAVSPAGVLTSINAAAQKLLNLKPDRALGLPIRAALGDALYATFWQPLIERFTGDGVFSAQVDVNISGRMTTLLVDGSRLMSEEREDLGAVLVFDDASEQLKLQRVAAWREVARRIAHEIKNPVTPIKLSAQRLLRRFHEKFEGDEREVFQSCLETILKQVDSLRDLVNEFSKFSRLPAIEPKPADINLLIVEVANFYRNSYPKVTFDTEALKPLPDLLIDRDQMNRVFMNLVGNAIDALEPQHGPGKITFKSQMLKTLDTVQIEVIDNGAGIPAHLRERVLEPYYSTKDTGTGLGLAIVNQIISDHGGYLRIAGNSPRGTRVIIELPARRPASA